MTTTRENAEFEALLDYLKRNRGFDFTGYKRPSLMRRVQKRLQTLGVQSFADYLDYLEVHPDEFKLLFNTILINVTGFFRDPAAWEYVAAEVIPKIIHNKPPPEPIRIWSAGCSTGEEPYTIAMLMAEALGTGVYRDRVKIYATDVDEEELNRARQATYAAKEVTDIPPAFVEKYFDRTDSQYVFDKDLRRLVIFGRHDLVQDAPISRVDLLVCRNTLMYFNAETQGRILAHFYFALNDDGFLFLGKAEMLLTHGNLFLPFDLRRRVFTKVLRVPHRERLLMMVHASNDQAVGQLANEVRLREAAFETGLVPNIVITAAGHLVLANARARALFGLHYQDLGRPLQDFELTHRPVELRLVVEQVQYERASVTLQDVEWPASDGSARCFEIQLVPLLDANGRFLGSNITYTDRTAQRAVQEELQQSKQALETAYEELQSTVEELETTNEELQSTNEELETMYEELQSTNEDLETMNEELQSTNAELETINQELGERTVELNRANSFLESIVTSLRVGVVVLDRNLQVQVWNNRTEDLWGLRAEEVRGHYFMNLDIGLPIEQLRQPIRSCLAGDGDYQEVAPRAVNRRGKSISCRVTCTPLYGPGRDIRGVILLMEEQPEPALTS